MSREEITINIIRWVRLVINNHNAVNSRQVELDSLFLEEFPESLWGNIERFLLTLSQLPCWTSPGPGTQFVSLRAKAESGLLGVHFQDGQVYEQHLSSRAAFEFAGHDRSALTPKSVNSSGWRGFR